jgi:hypothetical protein
MKTYCETLNHWLYHPLDTSVVCDNRAKKLGMSECRKCRGVESNKTVIPPLKRESIPQMIPLNVDRNRWIEALKGIREEYGIREGTKRDEMSARRIAILVGELYLSRFGRGNPKALLNVMIIEKDAYDLSIEYRLKCDTLEHEERVKPHLRKQVLSTWGIDKASGVEGYFTQLKEWTIKALLGVSETIEEEKEYGTNAGEIDFGSRSFEGIGLEEAGIG